MTLNYDLQNTVVIDTPEKAKAFEEAYLKAEEFAKHRNLESRKLPDKPSDKFWKNFGFAHLGVGF